ncbi:MAG: ATP-binding cassette domain-containing protein [Chitinophagales bacterium]|nr:ABC transporter ATP-binding protein [Chitinophagales bacterium]MDW8392887.1 ATP-binding cassette domain-containing protein [Chitinophagales bacterium]
MSVTVSGLTKKYGNQLAVHEVSFSVRRGEVLGFLGPNGAGKTTTMRIICGYLSPTAGTVTVCGYDITTQSLEARRCIGYLPENNPLYADLYVREFLSFVAALHRVKHTRHRVDQVMEQVGLGAEQKKKIGALSKGYRQRLGLAQALIHDPQVLVLDEPTVGLDPLQLQEIRQLIRDIGREKTVILSTHIMQEVKQLCSRAVIISRGRIMADGTLEALLTRSDAALRLIVTFSSPVEARALLSLPGVLEAQQQNACTVIVRAAFANQAQLFAFAQEKNNMIRTIQEQHDDLEEVFRILTSETPASS